MRAFLALALIASPAVAADQFDLVCQSSSHDSTFHYRVDLKAQQWCVTQDSGKRLTDIGSACPQRAILGVTADKILFSGLPIQIVDRASGQWVFKYEQSVIYRGTCQAEPFSGFPTFATKF